MATRRHISLPKLFASGDVSEWCQRFEICSKVNDWDNATMALKLPTLLEGEALSVWLELTDEQQKDYKEAKKQLVAKMAQMGFTSLEDFHRCKLQPGESVSVYLHDLKRLLDQALPDLEANARKQVVLHQFMSGLPTNISAQLRATGDAKELDSTVEKARLLLAIGSRTPSPAAAVGTEPSEVQQLKDQLSELTQVAVLTTLRATERSKDVSQLHCFDCDGVGHVQRNCPSPRRQQRSNVGPCHVCGRFGHLARDCRRQGNKRGMSVMGSRHPSNH